LAEALQYRLRAYYSSQVLSFNVEIDASSIAIAICSDLSVGKFLILQ
jgi:hypothetical protein